MDRLTLELFTNKTQYRKYLSKNEPEKYSLLEEKREKRMKYKHVILDKIEQLITFPETTVSALIQQTFDDFVDVIIRDLEIKELEVKDYNAFSDQEEEDDTVLFGNMDCKPSPILRELENENEKKTFWKTSMHNDYSYGEKQDGIFNHYPTNTAVRKRFVGRRNSIFP